MMRATTSRRSLLGFTGVGALALAAPTVVAASPLADVEASFAQWKDALFRLNNDRGDEAYDDRLWEKLDKAELEIGLSDAVSPRLAAIRVWIALQCEVESVDQLNAVAREDLPFFLASIKDQARHVQTMIQALHALYG